MKNKSPVLSFSSNGHGYDDGYMSLESAIQDLSTSYSTESVFAGPEDGFVAQGELLSSIAAVLQPSLENSIDAAAGAYKNTQGMLLASYAVGVGSKAADYAKALTTISTESSEHMVAFDGMGRDYATAYSPEAFDNQRLNEYMHYSAIMNYALGDQGDVVELFYRTVATTPDQAGVVIELENLFVQNAIYHSIKGDPTDFGYRRLIDASIDPTILDDNGIECIPEYNADTAEHFVDDALVPPHEVTRGNRTVNTNFLRTGREINYLSLGHLDTIERNGTADFTDALDRSIGLDSVLQVFGSDAISWEVKGQAYTRFLGWGEQGSRGLKLNYAISSWTLDKNTKNIAGDEPKGAGWDLIRAEELTVRLRGTLTGSVDVQSGTGQVNSAGQMNVLLIADKNGELLDLKDVKYAPIISMVKSSVIEGYKLDASVTNSNIRFLGMLLDSRVQREILVTKTRAPFVYVSPISETRDTRPAQHLAFAVQQYTHNEGLKHLVESHERMMRVTGGIRGQMTKGNFENNVLQIEGPARQYINPYVQTFDIDLKKLTQSTMTVFNLANAQEAIINFIRNIMFDVLQTTNYEAACRFYDGGSLKHKWKVAIGTSKRLHQFMTVTGDSRTLGDKLPCEIQSDVSQLLEGKMYISLVRESEGIDIMSSGVCLQTPTLVTRVDSWRNDRTTKELIAQPRFNHYTLLPIRILLNVTGVEEVLAQPHCFRVDTEACGEAGDGGQGGADQGNSGNQGGNQGVNPGDTGAGTTTP